MTGRYPCPGCDAAFETPEGLAEHRSERHGVAVEETRRELFEEYRGP